MAPVGNTGVGGDLILRHVRKASARDLIPFDTAQRVIAASLRNAGFTH
jgi:hypothetical protein